MSRVQALMRIAKRLNVKRQKEPSPVQQLKEAPAKASTTPCPLTAQVVPDVGEFGEPKFSALEISIAGLPTRNPMYLQLSAAAVHELHGRVDEVAIYRAIVKALTQRGATVEVKNERTRVQKMLAAAKRFNAKQAEKAQKRQAAEGGK